MAASGRSLRADDAAASERLPPPGPERPHSASRHAMHSRHAELPLQASLSATICQGAVIPRACSIRPMRCSGDFVEAGRPYFRGGFRYFDYGGVGADDGVIFRLRLKSHVAPACAICVRPSSLHEARPALSRNLRAAASMPRRAALADDVRRRPFSRIQRSLALVHQLRRPSPLICALRRF